MMKLLLKIYLVAVGSIGLLNASIVQTASLNPVEEAIEQIDKGALFVFDIEGVLITCSDPTFHDFNKEHFEKVCSDYKKIVSAEDYERLYSIVMKSREVEIVDGRIYALLDRLAQKKIHTIGLTHSATGRLGEIESVESWRLQELQRLGINFEMLSPFSKETMFQKLQGPEGAPHIKNGVIFTAKLDKQKVLKEAFKLLDVRPKSVLFIDDRMDNILAFQAFCKKLKIPFQGFHYTAVCARPKKHVDEKLIELQLNILFKDGRWVSLEEAAEIFNDD